PPGRTLPAARLAEYHQVPPAYLAKHLQALSAAGIVESVPGPKGGYRLARAAADVTVLDVVLAVDGDEAAFVCTEIRQCGPAACVDDPAAFTKPCGIARLMWAAEDAWRQTLRERTIVDLLDGVLRDATPEQLVRGAEWIKETMR
ncbi:MAG TPA: Rrf2 family transcriptional regulator, partial [Acidimicrobiales bacterium]|nr:Rrf2 family transcriptional regulator [Acidimicrobiales bacterium]